MNRSRNEEETTVLRRFPADNVQSRVVPPVVNEVVGAPGRPLTRNSRKFMEPRFGRDFSMVRVHDDSRAAESARAVNTEAYTVGNHIVFGSGRNRRDPIYKRLLLAHELTHVVQQGQRELQGPITMGSKNDRSEQEAHTAAFKIMGHQDKQVQIHSSSRQDSPTLQGGWPLIVAAVAGVGAGIYAIWAYRCLSALENGLQSATIRFRRRYHQRTNAPVTSNIWDAFGHCWIACEGTKQCGATTTAIAGKSREFWREYLDSAPHDSYQQDTNNQNLGRGFGDQELNCSTACGQAIDSGTMDLSAPQRLCWTPGRGLYPPSSSTGCGPQAGTAP